MKQVRFFVEGKDDEVFIYHVAKPLCGLYGVNLEKRDIIEYSQTEPRVIAQFIRSTIHQNIPCFFLADKDSLQYHTVEQKKRSVCAKYQVHDEAHVVIVIEEIESWYLAGLSREIYLDMNIGKYHQGTEHVTKEEFNRLLKDSRPTRGGRATLLPYLLHRFDEDIACERNTSFAYFAQRLHAVLQAQKEQMT